MTTEWNKYKDRQQKQQESRTKKKKTEETPEQTLQWLDKFTEKLGTRDAAAWTDEEKQTLHARLAALDDAIQALLSAPTASASEQEGVSPTNNHAEWMVHGKGKWTALKGTGHG